MSRTSVIPDSWLHPASPAEARATQLEMLAALREEEPPQELALVGGADISSTRFDPERRVHAAIVTLDWPGLAPVARAGAMRIAAMPYIPGLLGFREVPAGLEAWERLSQKPGLLLVDGHGRAHPRGLGIACHFGLVLDVPTIGVAKSLLVGRIEGALPNEPGAEAPLLWRGQQIGVAIRTRRGANPLYISAGHRMTLEGAVAWVRRLGRGYRLPEPTRHAHLAAGALRREWLAEG